MGNNVTGYLVETSRVHTKTTGNRPPNLRYCLCLRGTVFRLQPHTILCTETSSPFNIIISLLNNPIVTFTFSIERS